MMKYSSRNQMKVYYLLLFIIPLLFFSSCCAKIPKESIVLSKEIGKGIESQQQTYINLLNTYFSLKKREIEVFFEREYLPKFIENIKEVAKEKGEPMESFTSSQMQKIIERVNRKSNEAQNAIEKVRIAILQKVTADQSALREANLTLTNFLESAVAVGEARKKLGEVIPGFDLAAFEGMVDETILKGGDTIDKMKGNVQDFFNKINVFLQKGGI